MATITANISASATLIPVSAEIDIGYYTIDDEAIYVTGMSRGAEGRDFVRRSASVDRAVGGTTAASHSSGATLTRYYPDAANSGGSGGVTVDNGTDPPVEVTTIVAPGATFDGDEATLASGLPTVVIRDSTGGTLFANPGGSSDPTPVTNYVAVRDDLGAAADLSDYPVFPAGVYLVGGYVDWLPINTPIAGFITAVVEPFGAVGLFPEGDLGYAHGVDVTLIGNIILAPTQLITLDEGRQLHMSVVQPFGGIDENITWVRWVFWAVQVVAL